MNGRFEIRDIRVRKNAHHAIAEAKRTGEPQAIVAVDNSSGGRSIIVIPEAETWDDEFEAFDGRVLAVAHEDGEVEI